MGLYLVTGTVFLFISILAVKAISGRYLVSAVFIFLAFYVHMFLDPFFRLGFDPYLYEGSLPFMYLYNSASYVFLVSGFLLYLSVSPSQWDRGASFKRRFLSDYSFYIAFFIVFVAFVFLVLGMKYFGRFDGGKGQFSYGGGGAAYRAIIMLSYLFYSLVPAMFISVFNDCRDERQYKIRMWLSVMGLFFVALYSVSQFGRQTILFVVVTVSIIYVDRFRSIPKRGFLGLLVAFLFVTGFSLLRKSGEGLGDIDANSISMLFEEDKLNAEVYFRSVVTLLPGQSVFSNVIQMMEMESSFFYGKTYLDSVLRVLFPDFIVGGMVSDPPSFWYKENHLSYVSNHGFDFSLVAETYMNFSYFGVLIFGVIGFGLALLSRKVVRSSSPVIVIFSSIMIVNVVVGLRNDSNAFLVRAVYFVLPFLVINSLPRVYGGARRNAG